MAHCRGKRSSHDLEPNIAFVRSPVSKPITLPYYLPPASEVHPDNRASTFAMAALDLLLMREHRFAMHNIPRYRDWVREVPMEQRRIRGLNFQRRRFERQSIARHRKIWAAVREHEKTVAGPIVSAATGRKKMTVAAAVA